MLLAARPASVQVAGVQYWWVCTAFSACAVWRNRALAQEFDVRDFIH
jgi:hypothetical protein